MKKIIIIIILFLFSITSHAQTTIPVEKFDEYLQNNKEFPIGSYIKDVNGLYNKFIGTWKTTYDNRIYTFFITKKTRTHEYKQMIYDELDIEYLITELNGTVVEDKRNTTDQGRIYGYKITGNNMRFVLHFWGKNSRCGNRGYIGLSYDNPTQIKIALAYIGDVVPIELCQNYSLSSEPLFPLRNGFTLVKE